MLAHDWKHRQAATAPLLGYGTGHVLFRTTTELVPFGGCNDASWGSNEFLGQRPWMEAGLGASCMRGQGSHGARTCRCPVQ